MGNRPSNEAGDSADSDALSSDEERASGSPAVLQLPSGLRLMVNRDTRQIHLLGPDPEEDGDSDDEVYQEEVRMPPLSLLTRILGGLVGHECIKRLVNLVLVTTPTSPPT